MRAIDGFSRILLEDYGEKLDAEGKRVIGVVRGSTQRMARMIDDILAFSRVGRMESEAADVDMQAAVRVTISDLEPATAGRLVDFEIGELPSAQGDATMLQQVWANLLGNAVKYTGPRDRAVITIGAEVSDGVTVYFVRDNGVGFDMRYADKLFGTFQRLHGAEFPAPALASPSSGESSRAMAAVSGRSEIDKGAAFFFSVGATTETVIRRWPTSTSSPHASREDVMVGPAQP